MTEVKRQPRPTLRQRQAEATRSLITTAAQELFLERGYAGTTIGAIAERAGVAVSTVYAVFSSKRGILRAIRQAWHGRSHIQEVTAGEPGGGSAEQRIETLAMATRRQWEMGADVIAIYTSAATADPDAAAELDEALQGRRKGLRTFAHGLKAHLRPGLSVDLAAAILQALCLAEVYRELVDQSGWSPDAYQTWLTQTLKRELLGTGG